MNFSGAFNSLCNRISGTILSFSHCEEGVSRFFFAYIVLWYQPFHIHLAITFKLFFFERLISWTNPTKRRIIVVHESTCWVFETFFILVVMISAVLKVGWTWVPVFTLVSIIAIIILGHIRFWLMITICIASTLVTAQWVPSLMINLFVSIVTNFFVWTYPIVHVFFSSAFFKFSLKLNFKIINGCICIRKFRT